MSAIIVTTSFLRYKTAMRAPIIQNHELYCDFGFLADTEATTQVLQGTYEYPEATKKYTWVLLQQAHSPQDLQETSSRRGGNLLISRRISDILITASRVHYGHYKAASYEKDLSPLQAAKLNLAISTGVPLARWCKGITILIEKAPGSTNISSFRAICLFEANANYLNKFVYAKQIMKKCPQCWACWAIRKKWLSSKSQGTHFRSVLRYYMCP